MEKERTAQDAYEDFGKAFEKLFAELLDLNVSPTDVNLNLVRGARVPEIFVPLIVRILVHRRTEREAVKQRIPTFTTPDPFARQKQADPAPPEPRAAREPVGETQASSEPGADGPDDLEEFRRRVTAANQDL